MQRTPLQRIRLGAFLLLGVFTLALCGYRFFGGYDWVESLWMVVVTISTVGYSEGSTLGTGMQLFSVGVIVLGMSTAAYTFSGIFHLVLEGELERIIGSRRMARDIDELSGHVIICGYGRMGQYLADELHQHGRPLVIIDCDAERLEEAQAHRVLSRRGDATEEEVLASVGVARASTLVTALPSDACNVFITLTARDLNPDLQIIARAEHSSTEKKLRQAGSSRVVMPAVIGARQMVRMITRPSTADLMELVAESKASDLELDEIVVSVEGKLAGQTVEATQAHRRFRLLVVAVKHPDGRLLPTPHGDYNFAVGDILMVMGQDADILAFRREFAE